MNIDWIGSPNYDTNRTKIDTVFIHWIVGTLASADKQFQKTTNGTSAHYGVEDNKIHQYVKEDNVAYHAGVYSWNQRSIGIEHSASPDRPASEDTYKTAGFLIGNICRRWGIPIDKDHIKPHNSVRATQCPGTMDIDKLISIALASNVEMVTIPQAELDQLRKDRDDNWNSYQTCQSSIAGHKSVATDWKNKFEDRMTQISVLEEKVKIAEDRLAEDTKRLLETNNKLLDQINELSKALPDIEKVRTELQGQLQVEIESREKLQEKYDKQKLELAKLKSPLPKGFFNKLAWLFQ